MKQFPLGSTKSAANARINFFSIDEKFGSFRLDDKEVFIERQSDALLQQESVAAQPSWKRLCSNFPYLPSAGGIF
jgi:hypothetical protein